MGPGRHPPSEVEGKRGGRVKMQMRLPLHVWAVLSCGREAESRDVEESDSEEGVVFRVRWCAQVCPPLSIVPP